MDGLLLLDKPKGLTSHDVVAAVRRRIGQKTVGHAGTLDPMATGLLLVLVGKATKRSLEFMGLGKSYRGSIRLGVRTDSWDLDGKVLEEKPVPRVRTEELTRLFEGFLGEQLQVPPVFSAIKKQGQKAYELARSGRVVVMEPRAVRIDAFRLEAYEPPEVFFHLDCSKGTYVRSVANAVGEKLGCGAALSSLTRTRVGDFFLGSALSLDEVSRLSPDALEKSLL